MIARGFARFFEDHSRKVRLLSLDVKKRREHAAEFASLSENAGTIVVLFPVYGMNAALPVYDWLKTVPAGKGNRVAVVSVSGGGEMWPNTACRWRTMRLLEKKGYDVFYENMMVMPSNCLYRYSDHLSMRILEAMPRKAAAIAEDILAGKRRRKPFPLLSWPVMFLCNLGKKSGAYWKKAVISAQCTSCGTCARDCSQDNITMKDGRPAFGAQCVLCLRCYYGCPAHAISPAKMRKLFFEEYDLEKIRERMKGVPLEPLEKCARGWLVSGVRRYLRNT